VSEQLQQLPVEKLSPAKDNPRKHGLGNIEDLVASIKSAGIIEPVIATQVNGGYEVVAGNRRLEAAKKAGLKVVPTIVRAYSEAERLEVMVIENLQREDLTFSEEAHAYQRLLEVTGQSQRELAPRLGVSQAHMSKRLSLLRLSAAILAEIDAGKIRLGDAEEIARLENKEDQKVVLEAVRRDPFTNAKQVVDRMQTDRTRLDKVKKAREAAKAKGLKVADLDDLYEGRVVLLQTDDELEQDAGVDVDPKAHAKEPCHGVVIDEQGRVIAVCIDPETHDKHKPVAVPDSKGKAEPAADLKLSAKDKAEMERVQKESAQRKNEDRARSLAKKARAEFIVSLLGSPRLPARPDVIDRVSWGLLQRAGEAEVKQVVRWLQLDGGKDHPGFGENRKFLRTEMARNADARLRVALALALAVSEISINIEYRTYTDEDAAHLAWLEKRGYKVTPIEAKKLGRKGITAKQIEAQAHPVAAPKPKVTTKTAGKVTGKVTATKRAPAKKAPARSKPKPVSRPKARTAKV
jgi:ParB family chromosome partitioning protein